MPLDVLRLRDSDLAVEATGEEFRAAVLLWCAAWTQVPAGSLPTSDQALSALAGFGRDGLRAWRKVKAGALRGFYLCRDGRMYHRTITEKVLEAWEGRKEYRDKEENENERLRRFRAEHKELRTKLREFGLHFKFNEQIDVLRNALKEQEQKRKTETTETVSGALPATAKTETGTDGGTDGGTVENQKLLATASPVVGVAPPMPKAPRGGEVVLELFYEFYGVYPRKVGKATASAAWRKAALTEDEARSVIEHVRKRATQDRQWLRDKQYIPHPATFLNQRRWTDEYERSGTDAGSSDEVIF